MIESLLILALLVYITALEVSHHKRWKELEDRYYQERCKLLDRLMAQDFSKFKQAEVLEKQVQVAEHKQSFKDEYDISDIGV